MTFTVSQVNTWRSELAAMPAPDPTTRTVGKRAALEMMAKDLQALSRRGYTTGELLELLATKGLHIHEETLRAVLRTAKSSATTRPRPSQSPTGSSPRAAGQIGQEEERKPDSPGTVTPTSEEPPPGQHQTQAQAARPTATSQPLANRPDSMAQAPTARKSDAAPTAPARVKAGPQVRIPAMPPDETQSDPSGVASDAKDRQPGVIREELRGFGQPGGVDIHRHNRARSQDTPAGPARISPGSRGTFTPRKDSDQL